MSWLNAKRGQNVLIGLVLIVGAGNLWATQDEVRGGQAAQRAEQARYEAGQRADAQAAKAAQVKSSVPVCMALLKLSQVHGSHGTSSATYGLHLEAALQRVYKTSGCPAVLALAGTPAGPQG